MHSSVLDSYRQQILPFAGPTHSKPASGSNRPFFARVESLRALAALAIAAYHVSGCALHNVLLLPDVPWQGVGLVQNTLRKLGLVFLPAHAALMVFFVISGFVLRLSLGHGPLRFPAGSAKFLLGRAFRMYPVVMFSMTWTVLLSLCRVYPTALFGSPLTLPLFLKNLVLLDVSINGTLWALQVELLMAPLIVLLYYAERKFGPGLLAGAAIATTVLAYIPRWAFWPPLSTNMFSFILGMTIPTLGREFVTGMSGRKATMWTLLAACVLLMTAPCLGLYSRNSAVLESYAGTLLVSLVAYRLDVRVLHFLDWKSLRLVGLSSGSYYVLHISTVPLTLAIAAAIVPQAWSTGFPALTGVLVIGVWLVALVPLALASFHLIEANGIALGKRVARLCHFDSAPPLQPLKQTWTNRRAAA